jgi:hypothetical protein
MQLTHKPVRVLLLGGLVAAAGIAGCGSDDSDPGKVAIQVTQNGNQSQISLPAKVEGGAVELTLDNSGKGPASAQLVKVDSGHTAEEALQIVGNEKPQEIPEWLRAEGGVGSTNPGETGTATVDLEEGHYLAVDDDADGKPPYAEFDVSGDNGADLPDTEATVTAATTGEDDPEYEWQVDGLKAGENTFTFVSEGDKALHHILAAPIKGDATLDDVSAELDSNGPPKSIDFDSSVNTSVIDGEKDEVTTFNLKPGRYAFICFLTDRDEPNKPHYKEGMLKEVNISG